MIFGGAVKCESSTEKDGAVGRPAAYGHWTLVFNDLVIYPLAEIFVRWNWTGKRRKRWETEPKPSEKGWKTVGNGWA